MSGGKGSLPEPGPRFQPSRSIGALEDGRLAEVEKLTKFELGEIKFDFVSYFRFLKKHGYVDFAEGPA